MKKRMSISRQNLALLALAGCLLCLLAGCVQVDADKQTRLRSLKAQRKSLETALSKTKREIDGTKGESGKQKRNQEYLARIAANLNNAKFMRLRSEKFWREHQAVFMEKEHRDIFSDAGLDGRLYFGTPAPVSANSSTRCSCDIGWMALATPGETYSTPIPIEKAKRDIQAAKATVVAQMVNTVMSPYAEMEFLAGPCVLMDHALDDMPADFLLDGFELLLEPEKEGKAPLQGKSIALVVMSTNGDVMQIIDEQRIELTGKDKDICESVIREDGRCLLRVFFGNKYGSLPIKKGQYWGIRVPKDIRVSCEYLGLPDGQEGLFPRGGGDVWIATDNARELKFARPLPKTPPKQVYAVAGCVYDEKISQDRTLESKIRQTLRPTATMAVFGTLDGAK